MPSWPADSPSCAWWVSSRCITLPSSSISRPWPSESSLNIQIFGRRDCAETRKAERWFKERRIPFQFIDLKEKSFSPRELESVARPIGWDNLLDREGKRFKEKGLAFMSPSRVPKVLLEDPLLARTPVVRNGNEAALGYRPEVWSTWK